jgi:hypothetical protein
MSTDTAAVFIGLGNVVGADRDEAAVANLHLVVEIKKSLVLLAILGAVPAAAEDKHHRALALQSRELPTLRGMVGELVVGEDGPRNYVMSHRISLTFFGVILRKDLLIMRGRCFRVLRPVAPKSFFSDAAGNAA